MKLTTDNPDAAQIACNHMRIKAPYMWRGVAYRVIKVTRHQDEVILPLDGVMSAAKPRPPWWEITLERV